MSGIRFELLRALLDPMVQEKRRAIDGLRPYVVARAMNMPRWWAWTAFLAYAITAKRIDEA